MTIHKIGIALLLWTAMSLSAHSQQSGSGAGEKYTKAPEEKVSSSIPLEEVYGIHAFFDKPGNEVQIQVPSKHTQYAWQNYSRFQKGAIVPRWGDTPAVRITLSPSKVPFSNDKLMVTFSRVVRRLCFSAVRCVQS